MFFNIQWSHSLITKNSTFIVSNSNSPHGSANFLHDVSLSSCLHRRELIEQLDRASLSILFNTAEGNGKRQGRQRAKFFDDARGSAFECAACLDASVARRFVSVTRIRPGKEMLARVVAMLTRLVDRFDTDERVIRRD
jgi:four helix bundle protein